MQYQIAESINAEVNRSVTYKTDLEQYGKLEFWEPAGEFGDCEDYALLKRQRLVDAGAPVADMLLATCTMPDGQGHMVLLVKTDQGWFVLDNNYNWPMIPSQLPYRWDRCLRGGQWVELSF